MALHGELSTYPLPDLLQWLDTSGRQGVLTLSWEGGERRLYVGRRDVVRYAGDGLLDRLLKLLSLSGAADTRAASRVASEARKRKPLAEVLSAHRVDPKAIEELAVEEMRAVVSDLIAAEDGAFHIGASAELDVHEEEGVPVSAGVRDLLLDALRRIDERGPVNRAFGEESRSLRSSGKSPGPVHLIARAALAAIGRGGSLGSVRLALGLSASATSRLVFELWRGGHVIVEGANEGPPQDPVGDMIEKGVQLLKHRQFDAASLLFSSLLAADPGDRRVRQFANTVEREQVAALYEEMSPLGIPSLAPRAKEALPKTRIEDRQVAGLINGSWDVGTLVLASPLRERETLKSLARLYKAEIVSIRLP